MHEEYILNVKTPPGDNDYKYSMKTYRKDIESIINKNSLIIEILLFK